MKLLVILLLVAFAVALAPHAGAIDVGCVRSGPDEPATFTILPFKGVTVLVQPVKLTIVPECVTIPSGGTVLFRNLDLLPVAFVTGTPCFETGVLRALEEATVSLSYDAATGSASADHLPCLPQEAGPASMSVLFHDAIRGPALGGRIVVEG